MARAWDDLVSGVRSGEERSLARLITGVENREPGWKDAMRALYPSSGRARVIGITGSPGAGKSTLVGRLARVLLGRGHHIGVIAVDPSSPFSGGALLGDRLRMRDVATESGIFIRSMATRGMLGGLCQSARDVARVMDAFGKDVILIETVGVGQDEIEVIRAAERVVVVCVPGQGDGIQVLKAGIMEIADLFVVNKSDLPGADELASDIESMLAFSGEPRADTPPLLRTSALKGEGIEELANALIETAVEVRPPRHDARIREEILDLVEREISQRLRLRWAHDGRIDDAVRRVASGSSDPYSVAEALLPALETEG